jgi:hypothetical protein
MQPYPPEARATHTNPVLIAVLNRATFAAWSEPGGALRGASVQCWCSFARRGSGSARVLPASGLSRGWNCASRFVAWS